MKRKLQFWISVIAVFLAGVALHAQDAASFGPQASEPIGKPTIGTHVSHADPNARPSGIVTSAAVPVTTLTGAGLTITATFDASVDAATQTVINNEIALYQSMYSNPITVAIYFYNMNSGLGQSTWYYFNVTYTSYRSGLASNASSADDAVALSNTSSGSTNPVNGAANISLKGANGRAVGLNTTIQSFNFTGSPCPTFTGDGCIGINVSLANSFGVGVLASTVEHEMDEVLGLGSAVGSSITNPMPEDLFRWASAGTRSYSANSSATNPCTSTPSAFFSIDGGTTNLNEFNNCNNGGDYGDWITHSPSNIQDAFTNGSASPSLTLTSSEARALDVIGYTFAKKRRGQTTSE